MRSRIAVAAATAVVVLVAAGPAAAVPTPAIGLKGGLCASTFRGDIPSALEPHSTKYGFGGGLSFSFDVGHGVGIQPELLFVMKGTSLGDLTLTDSNGTPVGTARVALAIDYIELPVLAHVTLPHRARTVPYLLLGPTLGLRGAQRQKIHGDVHLSLPLHVAKETDVGAAFGLGAEIGAGRARFTVEGRYTLGLSSATESYFSDSARNGALMVLTGVAFHP